MASLNEEPGIPGKRLLPRLAIGCLLFAAIMGFGTYWIANLMTPVLRKRNEEYLRTHQGRLPDNGPTPHVPTTRL